MEGGGSMEWMQILLVGPRLADRSSLEDAVYGEVGELITKKSGDPKKFNVRYIRTAGHGRADCIEIYIRYEGAMSERQMEFTIMDVFRASVRGYALWCERNEKTPLRCVFV